MGASPQSAAEEAIKSETARSQQLTLTRSSAKMSTNESVNERNDLTNWLYRRLGFLFASNSSPLLLQEKKRKEKNILFNILLGSPI